MRQLDLNTYEGRHAFYNIPEWRKLRSLKIKSQPLCEICLSKGILKPSVDVHHIKDIAECPTIENALDYGNLQCLCKECHSKITGKKEKPKWKPFNLKEFLDNNTQL